jgi:hypothetical protein
MRSFLIGTNHVSIGAVSAFLGAIVSGENASGTPLRQLPQILAASSSI